MNISISRDGVEIGEWPEAEISVFYRDGQLLDTDFYWREGMAEWRPLSELINPKRADEIAILEPVLPQGAISAKPAKKRLPLEGLGCLFSALSLLCCLSPLAIPGVIIGHVALKKATTSNERITAITILVVGYISMVFNGWFIFIHEASPEKAPQANIASNAPASPTASVTNSVSNGPESAPKIVAPNFEVDIFFTKEDFEQEKVSEEKESEQKNEALDSTLPPPPLGSPQSDVDLWAKNRSQKAGQTMIDARANVLAQFIAEKKAVRLPAKTSLQVVRILDDCLEVKVVGGLLDGTNGFCNGDQNSIADIEGEEQQGLALASSIASTMDSDMANVIQKGVLEDIAARSLGKITAINVNREQWKEALSSLCPGLSQNNDEFFVQKKDNFLKVFGDPDKVSTDENKTYWDYQCNDGIIRVTIITSPNLPSAGTILGRVDDLDSQ